MPNHFCKELKKLSLPSIILPRNTYKPGEAKEIGWFPIYGEAVVVKFCPGCGKGIRKDMNDENKTWIDGFYIGEGT